MCQKSSRALGALAKLTSLAPRDGNKPRAVIIVCPTEIRNRDNFKDRTNRMLRNWTVANDDLDVWVLEQSGDGWRVEVYKHGLRLTLLSPFYLSVSPFYLSLSPSLSYTLSY